MIYNLLTSLSQIDDLGLKNPRLWECRPYRTIPMLTKFIRKPIASHIQEGSGPYL